jgi:glutathione S-transferase
MITVYAAYNSPPPVKGLVRDLRVMWALEELGMPYTFHWMDIVKAEHKEAPNRAINPFGKIPSFTDGDVKLFETGAILFYLYEKAGKIPADAARRAELLQWMFAALNTVEQPFLDIAIWDSFWKDRPGRDVRYPEVIEVAKTRLAELERGLGKKTFLLGEEFGPADILMTTALNFARHQPAAYENAPIANAYLERCRSRPAYQTALAKQGVGPKADAA